LPYNHKATEVYMELTTICTTKDQKSKAIQSHNTLTKPPKNDTYYITFEMDLKSKSIVRDVLLNNCKGIYNVIPYHSCQIATSCGDEKSSNIQL
jgi:hypothetical protein